MFKRVDEDTSTIEGYSYLNLDGDEEYVSFVENLDKIEIEVSNKCSVKVYHQDIPKLLKALQAAYDYKQGK